MPPPQTTERFPLVAIGTRFWGHLRTCADMALVNEGTISPADKDFLYLTDSPEGAVETIQRSQKKT